jgi:hypothetical protein
MVSIPTAGVAVVLLATISKLGEVGIGAKQCQGLTVDPVLQVSALLFLCAWTMSVLLAQLFTANPNFSVPAPAATQL